MQAKLVQADRLGRDARDDADEQREILRAMRHSLREQSRLLAKLAGETPPGFP